MVRSATPALAWTVCLLLMVQGLSAAQVTDETADSASWLLRKATLLHRDGRHNVLLRALRQLQDPSLEPFFARLVQSPVPALKAHGVLGLAEISPKHKVDLALVADIKDPLAQAQIIGSGITDGLIDLEQCRLVVESPGYEPAIRIIAATRLASENQLKDLAPLAEARSSPKLAMKGMYALLQLRLGDAAGLKSLRELDASSDPTRDEVRSMILQSAMSHKLSQAGPWALEVARSKGIEDGLRFVALRVAMAFKAPGAAELWEQQFEAAKSDPADRIRLAVLAVDLADGLPPALFEKAASDPDPLIGQLGRVGRTIAGKQPPDKELMKLLELNHNLSSQWVLQYAQRLPTEAARPVLVGIVLAAEAPPNPRTYRAQRVESAVFAAEYLLEKDSASRAVLVSLLKDAPELTQEAILMGLLKSKTPSPGKLIDGIALRSETAQGIALLIRARGGEALSQTQLRELSLIVRGGSGLEEPLRLQAAWAYLKITRQENAVLTTVLAK